MSRAPGPSDSELALADALRAELERERLRADRAIAYGARLLLRLESVDKLFREYAAHRPGCTDVDPRSADANCSCGLRAHLQEVDAWAEMTVP